MITAQWQGLLSLYDELRYAQLTPIKKRRLNQKISRAVVKQTRKNVRGQKDLRGRKFKERHKKRSRRGKMLSGLVKGNNIKQRITPDTTTIGFGALGKRAWANQYGHSQTVTKQQQSRLASSWKDKPATTEQAAAMIRLGFRLEKKGGIKKRVSRKWIKDNLSRWQALGILYDLKNGTDSSHDSWKTETPAREFFANDTDWVKQTAIDIARQELSG